MNFSMGITDLSIDRKGGIFPLLNEQFQRKNKFPSFLHRS